MNSPCPHLILPLIVLALMAGCRAERATLLDADTRQRLASLPYPVTAEYGPDLDIVATQTRAQLVLSNRTPSSYESRELWLNRQYVWEVDRINIGGGNRFNLTNFINEHGEPLPTPGFLRPDQGTPIVLVELYDPQTQLRNRLLVQQITGRITGVEGQD